MRGDIKTHSLTLGWPVSYYKKFSPSWKVLINYSLGFGVCATVTFIAVGFNCISVEFPGGLAPCPVFEEGLRTFTFIICILKQILCFFWGGGAFPHVVWCAIICLVDTTGQTGGRETDGKNSQQRSPTQELNWGCCHLTTRPTYHVSFLYLWNHSSGLVWTGLRVEWLLKVW